MKIIILAGGMGTRLGQQVEAIPKPMVLIGNKPILWHIMKIYSCQGFNDFIICLGEKAHVIKDYFSNYEHLYRDYTVDIASGRIEYHSEHEESSWKVTLVDTGLETLKGGRIKRIEKYLDSEVNMLTYGDGLSDVDLNKLLEFHKAHGKLVTITAVHQPSRFGELDERNGKVLSFTEKPKVSKNLINGGFMAFNKEMLNYLTGDKDCDFEIGALDKLAKMGQVMAYKHQGLWECLDHERDVIYLNEHWRTGKAFWKLYK
jgi:glucose-1-phosphate cytidylyltransferase